MDYKIYILRLIDDTTPRYVGITSYKLQTRLVKHLHDIKRKSCKNNHKKNWLSKYRDSVIIEQIDSANSIDEMKEKEIFYIKKFKDEGISLLNATNGGDGAYGYKHTEESIRKMSGINNKMYGKKHTPEWIENAKKRIPPNKGIKTGIPAWNRGISPTEEIIEKNRQSHIGKKNSEETKIKKSKSSKSYLRKIPIECLINNIWIRYASAKDAANILDLDRIKIISVCKGRRKTTGGLFFRYLGDDVNQIEPLRSGRRGNKVSIEYLSNIVIYDSIIDASVKSGIPRVSLSRIIKGQMVNKYVKYKIKLVTCL